MPAHDPQAIVALEEAGAFVESNHHGEAVMVNLYGTQITDDGLQDLKELVFLEKLQLRGCRNFTDAGLKHLRGLAKLGFVNLWGTPVTDIGLEHLRELAGLKTLLLGDTSVTDAGLENLEGLTKLETMDLSATRVTEEGVRQLRQMLPNCTI